MEKVLLRKTLLIPEVTCRRGEDCIDEKAPGVETDIYGVFEVGPVSIRLDPIGGTFFHSIEELNEKLGTVYDEDDAMSYDVVIKKKDLAYKDYIKSLKKEQIK